MVLKTHPDDVHETDDLPEVNTTSGEYALGFDAVPKGSLAMARLESGVVVGHTPSNKFYLSRVVGW